MRIKNPTDFCAGLLFGAFGLVVALYAATHYRIGTAFAMQPGYFPTWVGSLVAILGLVLVIRSIGMRGPGLARLALRPIVFVICGSVAFGYLVRPLGFIIATLLLVLVSAAGGRQFRWREAIPLAFVLALFAFGVFVYGLGLPFPMWPEAFE